jgi:hypothetical protein
MVILSRVGYLGRIDRSEPVAEVHGPLLSVEDRVGHIDELQPG